VGEGAAAAAEECAAAGKSTDSSLKKLDVGGWKGMKGIRIQIIVRKIFKACEMPRIDQVPTSVSLYTARLWL
jgi:hypothetical protein